MLLVTPTLTIRPFANNKLKKKSVLDTGMRYVVIMV